MSYTDPVTVTGLTAEDAVTRLKFCMEDDGSGGIRLKVGSTTTPSTTKKTPTLFVQAVASAGTAEAWVGSATEALYFMVEARKVNGANTGAVFVGTSAVDQSTAQQISLTPGERYEFRAPPGIKIDLNEFYVDADNNDDGIVGFYLGA